MNPMALRSRRHRLTLGLLILVVTACSRSTNLPGGADRLRLTAMASDIANVLSNTERQTTVLADEVRNCYPDLARRAQSSDSNQYHLEANGVYHRPDAVRRDLPAVFVSGIVKVDDEITTIVRGTESIDAMLKHIPTENSAVVQAYYNDRHSYNRIYPPFDVLTQYPPGMDIPSYNFYYLADELNNPSRAVVWVKDPYVDPAGRGWMVSCIAPVYHGNQFEGVCGLDITVESMVRNFDFEGSDHLCLLASADGTVVATGETLIEILRLPALKNHRYVDTVRSDTFRSADYNMLKSRSVEIRQMARTILSRGEMETSLQLDDLRWRVHATPVTKLGWSLMEFESLP